MVQEDGIDRKSASFIGATEAQPAAATYQAVAIAMIGAIMFGIDCGNFGAVIGFKDFIAHWCVGAGYGEAGEGPGQCSSTEEPPATWDQVFIMLGNVLITAGASLGAISVAPMISGNLGRRPCISIGSFLTFIGCLLSVMSFGVVGIFFFSRFVTGFGVGVCCYALPMYNSEIATPKIRGRTGGLFQFNVVMGGFISTLVTAMVQNWYLGMMLPGIAGLIVSLLVWTVPESPRWVLQKKGEDECREILRRVRVGDVSAELAAIKEGLDAERNTKPLTYGDLFQVGLRNRVFVACWLQVAQQLTGVNAVLGNAFLFFSKMGMAKDFVYTFNIIWNATMVVGITCGLALIDHPAGGRRKQLMVAAVAMTPPLFITAAALSYDMSWIIGAVMLCIYAWAFQFAWGTVPWVYPSEIFSMAEKQKAMGLAVFFQYGVNTLVYFTSPIMIHWTIVGTMVIFGFCNLAGLLFVCMCVKETKGIPLEMVPDLFEAKAVSPAEQRLA